MHESVFAQKVIDDAVKQSNKSAAEIKSAVIEVGELAQVTRDDLEYALHGFVDWKLEVREVPAVVSCACGFKGHPKVTERGHHFSAWECPECGVKMPELVEGGDIKIIEVEV
ncbi:MAG: hydrogenase/urease maturation nickel metallochaperone HypA [Candidatus Micrarchaeota archaeon]